MTPAWQGEVMLLQWAESSTRGRTITLLLPEDDETHPFREYGIKSGKRAGQRFMAVFVGLNDDESPAEPPLSTEAVMLCKDTDFWSWASDQTWELVESEESAKRFLCQQLSIASRAELNTDERAASAFRLLVAKYRKDREFF